MAKKPSLQERLEKLQADSPAPAAPASSASADPYERAVDWAAEQLPAGTPNWLRTVGRWTIPQNSPELALAALLSPIPGGLAGATGAKALAAPLLEKLAAKTVPAFLARAGLTGAAVGAVGAATGHDPLESGVLGAGGRMVGEGVGAGVKALVQAKVTKRMMGAMTSRLADSFRDIIGPWLPEGASDQRVIQSVLSDEPSRRVIDALTTMRQKHANTWVKVLDLEPELVESGVVHTWKGGAAGPGRVDPATVKAGMVWPPVRDFEKKLTPGREVSPYGAVESSPRRIGAGEPGGALVPPERGMVPFGSLDAQIEARSTEIEGLIRAGVADRNDVLQLAKLYGIRQRVAERINDPQMVAVLKEYGRTKQLRDWLWGATKAPKNHGERVVGELLDREGNLSKDGAANLVGRLASDAPRLSQLRPDEVASLGHALNWDLAYGGARAEAGRGLSALMPGVSWFGGIPHMYWHGKGPTPGFVPNWEAARTMTERVAPDALKALTGTVPVKFARPANAQATEPPAPRDDNPEVFLEVTKPPATQEAP